MQIIGRMDDRDKTIREAYPKRDDQVVNHEQENKGTEIINAR